MPNPNIDQSPNDLIHPIAIQSPAANPTRDAFGGVVPAWETVRTTWAAVTYLTGRELVQAQQIVAQVTHSVKLRYCLDSNGQPLTSGHRIVFKGRYLNIAAVGNPMEQAMGTMVTALCVEEV